MILGAHERSTQKLDQISSHAEQEIDQVDLKVKECRADSGSFFTARKRIAEASCH